MADWLPMGGEWELRARREPVVGTNLDGRLEVFLVGYDGSVYHKWQTAPNGEWDDRWASLGGTFGYNPRLARNADGRLEVFVLGPAGQLYHKWQAAPNADWVPNWASLGGDWPQEPVVARNSRGCLEAFAVGRDEVLYHKWQVRPNGGWVTDWASLGGSWPSAPVVGINADERLELFLVGHDQQLYVKPELRLPGTVSAWGPAWASLGGEWAPGPPAGVTRNIHNGLELFLRGQDGHLYRRWQALPGRWADAHGWGSLEACPGSDPVVSQNADGRLEVFVVEDGSGRLLHRWEFGPAAQLLRTWASLGGAWSGRPGVASSADGTLTVFLVGRDEQLHRTQQLPSLYVPEPSNEWANNCWIGESRGRLRSLSSVPSAWICPLAGEESNWAPRPEIAGSTSVRYRGRPEQFQIELRGWIRGITGDCQDDGDWTYDLEPDPAWLDDLGCDLPDVLSVGNIYKNGQYREPLVHEPLRKVNVPAVHVEHVPWKPGRWRPGGSVPLVGSYVMCPKDWRYRNLCPKHPQAVYSYDPRRPFPGSPALAVGDYVRMFGTLITDVAHDELGVWEEGADGGPARWVELHPVDVIEPLTNDRKDITYGVAIVASLPSAEVTTLDCLLPYPPAWGPQPAVEVSERVLPGTDQHSISDGNADHTGALYEAASGGVRVQVSVRRRQLTPGKFAALYRIRARY